jgi:hypothetical protein
MFYIVPPGVVSAMMNPIIKAPKSRGENPTFAAKYH